MTSSHSRYKRRKLEELADNDDEAFEAAFSVVEMDLFFFFCFEFDFFIFCSSISAYGELAESDTTEDYRFAPENLYGATKASCDLLLKKYYENYNMDIISLRLSTIYGHRRSTSCFINDIINSGIKNKEITLPFKSNFCWPSV